MGRVQAALVCVGMLLWWHASTAPAAAHWADLAVAEVALSETHARMTLTFPTGLVASAVRPKNGSLSPEDVRAHRAVLQEFLGKRIRMTDGARPGLLTVEPAASIPSNLQGTPGTHSTILLIFTWTRPIEQFSLHYDLFLPGVSTASCLVTVVGTGKLRTFVFTPDARELTVRWGGRAIAQWISRIALVAAGLIAALVVGHRVSGVVRHPVEMKL